MIEIDGSFGEGGGQILRTSLAMSLITKTPLHLYKIRAGRQKPGLQQQHLTCVLAAAKIGDAQVSGAKLGSTELVFQPGELKAGRYNFPIGTAGSCSLVFQTVLPPLLLAEGTSELRFEGGTHNDKAPPYDFLERAFVPLLNAMGANVEVKLEQYGFYPRGGGAFTAKIEGGRTLSPIELTVRGAIQEERARALVVRLPASIGERELDVVKKSASFQRFDRLRVEDIANGPSPGNALFIEAQLETLTEVFTGFGERGKPAESVAEDAVREYEAWKKFDVPIGEHLADQLLIPFALAGGGAYRTVPLSLHTSTNIETLRRFLDLEVKIEPEPSGAVRLDLRRVGAFFPAAPLSS
jgi:RNA 3'-terminal phosphate cyclase (ATP)